MIKNPKKISALLLAISTSLLLNSQFVESQTQKIAYVDIQKALEMTKSGQKVQKEFKSEVDEEQKQIDKKKTEYEKIKDTLEKQKGSLNEKAVREKEEELISIEKELKRSFQDSQEKLRRKNATLVGELVKKMRTLVDGIGKEKGYTLVVEKNSQFLLYADPELDITDDVVKKFDAID